MRAIVQTGYGTPDVLELREVDPPVVRDDEVLVRVRAASVHPDVWHVVTGRPYALRLMGAGLRSPRQAIPGTDLAGRVESVGRAVTRFRAGDEVFGETIRGHQWQNGGAFAEYAAVPQDALAPKPANVSFEQAAAVPTSGLIALRNLPATARTVLVNGAGGGVGALAVQIAKAQGAQVTGVDHPAKLDAIRSLGADRVVDHTREDFTRTGDRYDLIFDVPGNRPFAECRGALTPGGRYVLIGHDHYGAAGGRWLGAMPGFFKVLVRTPFVRELRGPAGPAPNRSELMATLAGFLGDGRLTPLIDRAFPLAETADALQHLTTGAPTGKIVITV